MSVEPLNRLVRALGKLPGVGRRSAERMAVHLAGDRGSHLRDLIDALEQVEQNVCTCSRCGGITLRTENPCRICSDPRRESAQVCVVVDPGDIATLERAGSFRGRYHALRGTISPMKGEGPRQMRIDELVRRIGDEKIGEVILAMNSDVEGDATAAFLQEKLAPTGVRITRLAYGLPAGSGIGYSDPVTLSRALEGRISVESDGPA